MESAPVGGSRASRLQLAAESKNPLMTPQKRRTVGTLQDAISLLGFFFCNFSLPASSNIIFILLYLSFLPFVFLIIEFLTGLLIFPWYFLKFILWPDHPPLTPVNRLSPLQLKLDNSSVYYVHQCITQGCISQCDVDQTTPPHPSSARHSIRPCTRSYSWSVRHMWKHVESVPRHLRGYLGKPDFHI